MTLEKKISNKAILLKNDLRKSRRPSWKMFRIGSWTLLVLDSATVQIDLNLKLKIIIWNLRSTFRYYVAFSDFHRATNDTFLTRSKHVARLSNTPPHSQQQYSSSTRAWDSLTALVRKAQKKFSENVVSVIKFWIFHFTSSFSELYGM